MEKSKVRITVCGCDFYIVTDDAPAVIERLGAELNDRMTAVMDASKSVSMTQAAVLCALEYEQAAGNAVREADALRARIKGYLDDAAKAKTERDAVRRELDRLKKKAEPQGGQTGGSSGSDPGSIWN